MRVHLGLGSNLGDRRRALQGAVDALARLDPQLVISAVYETAPVGGPAGQSAYLNCVVRLETERSPRALLALAHELEAAAGRVRAERFGPRTLDVDLLLVEGVTSDDPELTLPHPRMYERAFVLAPLEELDPDFVSPGWRQHLGGEAAVAAAVTRLGPLVGSGPARTTDTADRAGTNRGDDAADAHALDTVNRKARP